MRQLSFVLALAVAGLFTLPAAQARQMTYWTQQGRVPDAESIRTLLAFEGGVLYAGTPTGFVFRTLPVGRHTVSWAPVGLPSGVYVYQLETPTFRQARRFVLLQ